jgi:hypothetical protein
MPPLIKLAKFREAMMHGGGRPRITRERNAQGKVRPIKVDHRLQVASVRVRRFGVSSRQSVSPLSGYLAGVLYLRGQITSEHLGRFYSFLQLIPRGELRAAPLAERVQGGLFRPPNIGSRGYRLLIKHIGNEKLVVLYELANDRLVCSVERLKFILDKVPLTRAGSEFSISCQTQRPAR